MSIGAYGISLYCECGVTLQYSGISSLDAKTRAAVEAVVALHDSHEKVTAKEARTIRFCEERRINPVEHKRRKAKPNLMKMQARSNSRRSHTRERPWHAVVQPPFPGARLRTACGLSLEGGDYDFDRETEFDADRPGSCVGCAKRVSREDK